MPSDLASPLSSRVMSPYSVDSFVSARPTHDVQMVDPDSSERRPHVFAPCAELELFGRNARRVVDDHARIAQLA